MPKGGYENIPKITSSMVSETQAISRLAFARQQHSDLKKVESEARVELARSILEMDKAIERGPAIFEQACVESAIRGYAEALADLVRGERMSSQAQAERRARERGEP